MNYVYPLFSMHTKMYSNEVKMPKMSQQHATSCCHSQSAEGE
jgi:hypothetical protein